MKYNVEEFYPTPKSLLEKATAEIKWWMVKTILEPSAGKGDIVDYICGCSKYLTWQKDADIDCVEIDHDLRSILTGKGYRVIHDDFLTFRTYKRYDLIIMNPPFSTGARHLMKALDMQKHGGALICILNAETIRNPYTSERKVLMNRLKEAGADIQFLKGEFHLAERRSEVEVALIKVKIDEEEQPSFFFDEMKQKSYQEYIERKGTELAPVDYKKAMVAMYNLEASAGIALINEYRALKPHILEDLRSDLNQNGAILKLQVLHGDLSVNCYVKALRKKYWNAIFRNPILVGKMTTNLLRQYLEQVEKLSDYDFSLYNINCIQEDIANKLVWGVEDCINKLFDELSFQYSYSDELRSNIHYYNGWKTNKAWYINKKVILPGMRAFSVFSGEFEPDRKVISKLSDIEKALNYLDGGLTEAKDLTEAINTAKKAGQTKKIPLKYFYATFYRKGTCHIEFLDNDLLKKLNIFGSQRKKWLPPGYGRKPYRMLEPEEKAAVDSFEGEEAYHRTLEKADYFIYDPTKSVKMLEAVA